MPSASAESSEDPPADDALRRFEELWLAVDERSASAESSEVWPADDALRECEELPVSDVCDSLE